MDNYVNILSKLYSYKDTTKLRNDRTNTGTVSLFGANLEYDFSISDRFPLFPLREMNFRNIVVELLWFLSGNTNIGYLERNGCKWWSNQCNVDGEVGPMYGKQWRGYTDYDGKLHKDQFKNIIRTLMGNPSSRRMVINSWEVNCIPEDNCDYHGNVQMGKMAIAPCHPMMQFYVDQSRTNEKPYLSLMFNMRSSDAFLGLPANIASYALLLHIVAKLVDMKPHRLIYNGGDIHLYQNHFEATKVMLDRYDEIRKQAGYYAQNSALDLRLPKYEIPEEFSNLVNVDDLDFSNEELIDVLCKGLKDYNPFPAISVRMAR